MIWLLFSIRIIVVPYVFSSPIASSGLPANFLNFTGKGLVSSRGGGGLDWIHHGRRSFFLTPSPPTPFSSQ